MRRKSYNFLDYRKTEFDTDYSEFNRQIDVINGQLQKYINSWFEKPLSVDKFVTLVEKLESLQGIDLDLSDKYSSILQQFNRDLENVKRIYQKFRLSPPAGRNLPPIASRIAWARQLYLHIEGPMNLLKARKVIMQAPEANKVVQNYNKVAATLIQYEMLYHKSWKDAVDAVLIGMAATVLVQHPDTGHFFVNFDPRIVELLEETRFMLKMKLTIPASAEMLYNKSEQLKKWKLAFEEILKDFEHIKARIPSILNPLNPVIRSRFEKVLQPGLFIITWRSVNVDAFLENCYVGLKDFESLVNLIRDLLSYQIEAKVKEIAETPLIELPNEEPEDVFDFVADTEEKSVEIVHEINGISNQIETSLTELLGLLKELGSESSNEKKSSPRPHSETETKGYLVCKIMAALQTRSRLAFPTDGVDGNSRQPSGITAPDEKRNNQRCGECENCIFYSIMTQVNQQKMDALIRCAAQALDALRRRLQGQADFFGNTGKTKITPAFSVNLTLSIPSIVLKPSLEETQQAVARLTQLILKVPHSVRLWEHQIHVLLGLLNREYSEYETDPIVGEQVMSLYMRQISEHKDVFRHMGLLQTIIILLKPDVEEVIHSLDVHSDLWEQEVSQAVADFDQRKASLNEYENVIKMYHAREATLEEITPSFQTGPLILLTEELRLALVLEARAFKIAFSKALNQKAGQQMTEIFTFFDTMSLKLSRPIQDLDDIRGAMATLKEVRDNEIKIDSSIKPIEEAYALLNKLELTFNDGNAERVDSLGYGWTKLRKLSNEVGDQLLEIEPKFKTQLIDGIKDYATSLKNYVNRYEKNGPMEPGIPPREASERMTLFQSDFDDLWAKYISYSGGEELFGLPVTSYPELQRIKRELGLLQKLYQLYNQVIESVNGYYDIAWAELDIEKINSELTEFQNRCRRLPKALKEWKAFDALSKMVNDFTETCPLMELMSNKAVSKSYLFLSNFPSFCIILSFFGWNRCKSVIGNGSKI